MNKNEEVKIICELRKLIKLYSPQVDQISIIFTKPNFVFG